MPTRVPAPTNGVDVVFVCFDAVGKYDDLDQFLPELIKGELHYPTEQKAVVLGNAAFAEKSFGITADRQVKTVLELDDKSKIHVDGVAFWTWYAEDQAFLDVSVHLAKHVWTRLDKGVFAGKRIKWD